MASIEVPLVGANPVGAAPLSIALHASAYRPIEVPTKMTETKPALPRNTDNKPHYGSGPAREMVRFFLKLKLLQEANERYFNGLPPRKDEDDEVEG